MTITTLPSLDYQLHSMNRVSSSGRPSHGTVIDVDGAVVAG